MGFVTQRLRLWVAGPSDAADMLDYYRRNREHLEAWEPQRHSDFYTLAWWTQYLELSVQESVRGLTHRLAIATRDASGPPVIGVLNVSNIVRGVFQGAHIGYSIDRDQQGKGYMTEALMGVQRFAFGELGLHRLMANYIPTNLASARALEKAGFEKEGFARQYLLIGGQWRDHVLTARIREEDPRD
ncbi:MAG: GNAT family N-acetyltransferase [Planctomycetes bacterium]|nr:GNAT family N-acetyltransferase [Planctomycetota bacterium]HRV81598.1 GNAT family N-acetyltransferase [Planctomycetota bacterium]